VQSCTTVKIKTNATQIDVITHQLPSLVCMLVPQYFQPGWLDYLLAAKFKKIKE